MGFFSTLGGRLRCYVVTEKGQLGIPIRRDADTPYIPFKGEPRVILGSSLAAFCASLPEGLELLLEEATVKFGDGEVVLHSRPRNPDMHALVWLCTLTGPGGKVSLTADNFEPTYGKRNGIRWVVRKTLPFPSFGVQALTSKKEVAALNEGVSGLDHFVVMEPGSGFNITRTEAVGDFDRAPPRIFVQWDGYDLRVRSHDRTAAHRRSTSWLPPPPASDETQTFQ